MLTSQRGPSEEETRESGEEAVASEHGSPHCVRGKSTDPGGVTNSRGSEANQASQSEGRQTTDLA